MRKVREILRLTYDAGLPSREVAPSRRREYGRPMMLFRVHAGMAAGRRAKRHGTRT